MKASELSGSTLAYLGDAVWSLLVREYLIEKGYQKPKDLQQKSVFFVSAKAQARFYFHLESINYFAEEETEIFKRGRNFKGDSVPKNTDVATYRTSTGFEAVIGFWYIHDNQKKIKEMWEIIRILMEGKDGTINLWEKHD
ncbi:MAG: Mini-ribonuclease 3 [Anaerorhabdus sp.]